jgi:hypothetical protein
VPLALRPARGLAGLCLFLVPGMGLKISTGWRGLRGSRGGDHGGTTSNLIVKFLVPHPLSIFSRTNSIAASGSPR